MSPDLDWQISSDTEERLIRQQARPPRWHRWGVLAAVALGVGLGLAYASIPEPPPAPTPTLPPPTIPARPALAANSLEAAVERDAFALGASAGETNFDLGLSGIDTLDDEQYAEWYYTLLSAGGRWGVYPADELYTIRARGTAGGLSWVDVEQRRGEGTYRQTRFYRRDRTGWHLALPARGLWSGGMIAIDTGQIETTGPDKLLFDLAYPVEDADYVPLIAERFSAAFARLCGDLKCGLQPPWDLRWGNPVALTVAVRSAPWHIYELSGDVRPVNVRLPSPRVIGVYVSAQRGDPLMSIALDALLEPVARLASGDAGRWATDKGGRLFLDAVINWQRLRVALTDSPLPLFFREPQGGLIRPPSPLSSISASAYFANRLAGQPRLPLAALWNWSGDEESPVSPANAAAVDQADAVIAFIATTRGEGAVVDFLKALGKARSLREAVGRGLNADYDEFEADWQQWISQSAS